MLTKLMRFYRSPEMPRVRQEDISFNGRQTLFADGVPLRHFAQALADETDKGKKTPVLVFTRDYSPLRLAGLESRFVDEIVTDGRVVGIDFGPDYVRGKLRIPNHDQPRLEDDPSYLASRSNTPYIFNNRRTSFEWLVTTHLPIAEIRAVAANIRKADDVRGELVFVSNKALERGQVPADQFYM